MVTEKCANALGLKRQHSRVTVSGISSSSVGQARGEVQVKLHSTVNKASIDIHALVFPKVTGILPKYNCDRQPWTHLEGLQLADPSYFEPGPVDVLLGADYTAQS
ncbi:hypothetical protein Ocin01_17759 [Orchesella cincta]|uniref:Uncharacterized protein n=1 Tax=Orchesella cincta TaxID=48709 RepID=A0A1D2M7H6_ORCCI|nr:hypothetical protein Ocin01_17759 [Orchesella cincta]